MDYNILTVVTPKVADCIYNIYQTYKKRGWNYQQYIACLDPYGEGHGKTPYSISPEQYGKFLSGLFGLWYQDLKMDAIHIFDSLKIMWDWRQVIWLNPVSSEEVVACSMW